ncbi:MAG: hypothetical protein HY902_02075 [Deltaproteobacteria bacterium]|nr:hypothetical protein [Deltaproteobacteria bacterium]
MDAILQDGATTAEDSDASSMTIDIDVSGGDAVGGDDADGGATNDSVDPAESGPVDGGWDGASTDSGEPTGFDGTETDADVEADVAGSGEACSAQDPLCGGGFCPEAQDGKLNAAMVKYKSELAAYLGPAAYTAFLNDYQRSLWAPTSLLATGAGHVQLRASWFNNVAANATGTGPAANVCACQFTKASLLPSGCVTLDIDLDGGTSKMVQFDVVKPADFFTAKASFVQEVGCAKVFGEVPTGKALVLGLPDGRTVTAYAGRASVYALLVDPESPISAVVRDLNGAALPVPVTAGVIEVSEPDNASPTVVPVDVSVCMATAAQVAESGCTCPKLAVPANVPPNPSPFWLTAASEGLDVTITSEFLDNAEGPDWSGVGLVSGPYDGSILQTCCHDCEASEPKVLCAGWAQTSKSLPVVVYASSLTWRRASGWAYFPISDVAGPTSQAAPLQVSTLDGNAGVGVSMALTPKTVPAGLRDSVFTSLEASPKYGPLTYLVTEWGPNVATVSLSSAKALACRKMAQTWMATSPKFSNYTLCTWTSATFGVHVDAKKAGIPVP